MRPFPALLVLAVSAVADAAPVTPPPTPQTKLGALLQAAAAGYAGWGRVDIAPRVAPSLCAPPPHTVVTPPKTVRASAAAGGPHGKKLYYLWASARAAYLDPELALPTGMTIVKESFEAVHGAGSGSADSLVTAAGEHLTTGARKELFIMAKLGGESEPGTDHGWIYGTVAPDGTVTSEGRVASCMGCHAHATRERLFGITPAKP